MKFQELVFNYDENILKSIIKILKSNNYLNLQYLPTRYSILAIIKEPLNILNFFTKKNHLLFYPSLAPSFYRFFMTKKNHLFIDVCFFNNAVNEKKLLELFPKKLINRAILNNIIIKQGDLFKFSVSFIPFDNYILIRDHYQSYGKYELDPEKFDQRVWMGSDSIIFTRIIKKYLKGKIFRRALEIGSGTGIQMIVASMFSKSCEAIDYNKRAVEFTRLNVAINKIKNVNSSYSNLFENVNGEFDLIIVNPWFIDLREGGLEEVPSIIENLDKYLSKNGQCIMLLNSFIKNGKDTVVEYLSNIIKSTYYDIDLYTLGYFVDSNREMDYEINLIKYEISYYTVIKKSGNGRIKRHETSFFRFLRDHTYLYLHQLKNNFKLNKK